MLVGRAIEAADGLIQRIRELNSRRCETCIFWRGSKHWWQPKGWRRCVLENKVTSPVDGCDKYDAR